jgi:predicted transcriptional regulator
MGKLYVYVPLINEEDYQKEQLQHFVDTVLRGDKNKLKLLGE